MKKTLAFFALALLAAIAAALFWLRGNLDGLVKNAIEEYGSAMTQSRVTVREVLIQPADGRGVIRGLVIGNPAGFQASHALKVEEIEIAIDLASLAGQVAIIRRIAIVAPDVIYEKGATQTNFDALQKNIAAYLGPGDGKGGKKLIVDELVVRNAKAQASAAFLQGKTMSAPLPDITLRDIGKAKGGVTPGELGGEIVKALRARLSAAISFDALAKSVGSALEKAGSAIKGLFQ